MDKKELFKLLVTKYGYDFRQLRVLTNRQIVKIACREGITAVLDLS